MSSKTLFSVILINDSREQSLCRHRRIRTRRSNVLIEQEKLPRLVRAGLFPIRHVRTERHIIIVDDQIADLVGSGGAPLGRAEDGVENPSGLHNFNSSIRRHGEQSTSNAWPVHTGCGTYLQQSKGPL